MRNLYSPFNRDDNTSPLNLINFNPFSCRSNDSVSSSNFSPTRFASRTAPPLLHNDDNSSDTSFDFYSICSGSENHRNWNSNGHGNLFEFGRDIENDELYRFGESEEFLPSNNNQVRKLKLLLSSLLLLLFGTCVLYSPARLYSCLFFNLFISSFCLFVSKFGPTYLPCILHLYIILTDHIVVTVIFIIMSLFPSFLISRIYGCLHHSNSFMSS